MLSAQKEGTNLWLSSATCSLQCQNLNFQCLSSHPGWAQTWMPPLTTVTTPSLHKPSPDSKTSCNFSSPSFHLPPERAVRDPWLCTEVPGMRLAPRRCELSRAGFADSRAPGWLCHHRCHIPLRMSHRPESHTASALRIYGSPAAPAKGKLFVWSNHGEGGNAEEHREVNGEEKTAGESVFHLHSPGVKKEIFACLGVFFTHSSPWCP